MKDQWQVSAKQTRFDLGSDRLKSLQIESHNQSIE